jgi:hypothetical protein
VEEIHQTARVKMRQISLGINQYRSNRSRVQIILKLYTTNIIRPIGVCTYRKKYAYFDGKSKKPIKNSKTIRDPYLGLDLIIHVLNSSIHLANHAVPLNVLCNSFSSAFNPHRYFVGKPENK